MEILKILDNQFIENQDTILGLLHIDKQEFKKIMKQEAFDFETIYHF